MDEQGVPLSLEAEVLELGEPLIVVDREFRIVLVNDAQVRLAGRARDYFLGKTIWTFLDAKTPNFGVFKSAYERCMTERVPVEFEAYYAPRDMWLFVRVLPLRDSRMAIFFRDVSVQRRSERERDRFAAHRQLALDAAQMGWWTFDPHTQTATVDPRAQQIMGLSERTVDMASIVASVHPEDRETLLAASKAVLTPGATQPAPREFRTVHPDGSVHWVESHGLATFEGGPLDTRLVGTFRDITQRKEHEQALARAHEAERAERRRLRAVIDALPTGVAITNEVATPLEANAAFRALFGGAPSEGTMHDTRPWTAYWPETGKRVGDLEWAMSRALLTGRPVMGDVIEIERFDGSGRVVIHLSASPIWNEAGIIVGGVVSAVDLTTQRTTELALRKSEAQLAQALETMKRTEERLRQAQKMEAVGQLAGGVAHDFNNLLTVILAGTEFLDDGLSDEHALHEEVAEIRKAGQRAATLVRQLLAFSRKQVLEPRVVDLNEVIHGLEGLFKRLLGEQLHLAIVLEPELHLCKVDTGQIEQVLVNLVVNARDAMPEGGRITIETGNVVIEGDSDQPDVTPGEHACVVISDTGSGMTPEVQQRAFEPFFTTKQPGRGTGLGLSTVYGIVRQSGGTVTFTSAPGQGTTFRLLFPCAVEGKRELTPRPTKAVRRGHETVLLVEDEPQVRAALEAMLRRAGYRVLTASGGDEAVRLSEQHPEPIDLLVTDVVMPHMNGRKLAEHLAPSRPSMRVLFMSGYNEDLSGLGGPNVHFIGKPMSSDALLARVREVLEG